MIAGVLILLLCQLIGESIVIFLDIPVPGAVLGILIIFLFLLIKGSVPDGLRKASYGLLKYLSLFYVPAGVGLLLYLDLLSKDWLPIIITLFISSIVTIAVTAFVLDKMIRKDK